MTGGRRAAAAGGPAFAGSDAPASGLADAALVAQGWSEAAPDDRVAVIACGALAREILALRDQAGGGFALHCLPALLHNRPEQIAEAVRARVRAVRAAGAETVLVAYADCGTGGALDRVCAEEGVARLAGPHCYATFDGQAAFAARAEAEIGAFYLTDFLARQFDALVWRGLGLDRHPELRAVYFAHYDRVVYLAQTEDAGLDARARAAAERLGLAYVRRFTGYGELAGFIARARAAGT